MITQLPPSPRSLMGEFSFFKEFSARRALQELGPNDPKLNMKMAESLLTISAEHFKRKWNFDPIAMKPTKGSFIWTPLRRELTSVSPLYEDPLSSDTCSRIPKPESSLATEDSANSLGKNTFSNDESYRERLPPPPTMANSEENVGSSAAKKTYQKSTRGSRSALAHRCLPSSPKTRQRKITEFGRQRKRLNSTSKSEEDLDSSPRKKIMLESALRS